MAQFDVHRNPGAQRETIPFVVVVQSAQFDRYRRRMVVPLVRRGALPLGAPIVGSRMNPVFQFQGEALVLHPLDMVSVDLANLGEHDGFHSSRWLYSNRRERDEAVSSQYSHRIQLRKRRRHLQHEQRGRLAA